MQLGQAAVRQVSQPALLCPQLRQRRSRGCRGDFGHHEGTDQAPEYPQRRGRDTAPYLSQEVAFNVVASDVTRIILPVSAALCSVSRLIRNWPALLVTCAARRVNPLEPTRTKIWSAVAERSGDTAFERPRDRDSSWTHGAQP